MKKSGIVLLIIAILAMSIIPLNLVFATQSDIQVLYKCAETNAGANALKPYIQVKNIGTSVINLADVEVRYWYTQDGTSSDNFECEWAQVGAANVTGSIMPAYPPTADMDTYLVIGFTSEAGALAPGASTGEIQIKIFKSDWSNYNQSNDFSFAPAITSYGENTKVTGYMNEVLSYGVEPDPNTPTPTPTPTATPTQAPTPTGTPMYKLTTHVFMYGDIKVSPESINGTGYYYKGTQVQVTAVDSAASSFFFYNWSGDLTGTKNPETIIMNSDKFVSASFVEHTPTPSSTPSPSFTPIPSTTAVPTPLPTPTATSGGIKVQFFNGNTAATTNSIYPNFKVVNTGSSAISLSNVKIRYYFTNDGTQADNFACDWSSVGIGNITCAFTTIAKTNADRYLEVGFLSSAGTLGAGAGIEVKGRLWKSDWSSFTQTNDYSFNSAATNYVDSTTVTGWLAGALKWGTEP